MATQQKQLAEQGAQIAELAAMLKQQLSIAPQVNQVNQISQVNQVGQVNQVIQIIPWDSADGKIRFTVEDVAAAFAENARLKEYATWSEGDLANPTKAPPYVTELLLDLVKRGHANPTARNVYLNPKRADQVLVRKGSGSWEVMAIGTAARALFDGVAETLQAVTHSQAGLAALPYDTQNALAIAGMLYQEDPDEYVKRAKGEMAAHLANVAPREARQRAGDDGARAAARGGRVHIPAERPTALESPW
jgi:hypothetical protein